MLGNPDEICTAYGCRSKKKKKKVQVMLPRYESTYVPSDRDASSVPESVLNIWRDRLFPSSILRFETDVIRDPRGDGQELRSAQETRLIVPLCTYLFGRRRLSSTARMYSLCRVQCFIIMPFVLFSVHSAPSTSPEGQRSSLKSYSDMECVVLRMYAQTVSFCCRFCFFFFF